MKNKQVSGDNYISYVKTYERLVYIDRKLRDGKKLNCFQLAEHFGINRKTAQKIINLLKESGAPIEFNFRERTYYYQNTNFKLPAITLTEGELFSLLVAQKVLKLYENTPYEDDLKRIYQKIINFLPDGVKLDYSEDIERIQFSSKIKSEFNKKIYDNVSESINLGQELEITYYSKTNEETSKRIIYPYYLICRQGAWYLIAFCTLRKEERLFTLRGIKDAKLSNKHFEKDEDLEIRMKKFIGVSDLDIPYAKGEYEVEIRVEYPKSVFIQENNWHPTQKIKVNKDKSINISFTLNSLQEIKRWIFGLGSEAMVIKPKLLIEDLRKEINKMVEKYTN